jgi:hypothetical protein
MRSPGASRGFSVSVYEESGRAIPMNLSQYLFGSIVPHKVLC